MHWTVNMIRHLFKAIEAYQREHPPTAMEKLLEDTQEMAKANPEFYKLLKKGLKDG